MRALVVLDQVQVARGDAEALRASACWVSSASSAQAADGAADQAFAVILTALYRFSEAELR